MKIFFVLLLSFQLVYFTSSIFDENGQKQLKFFRKHYEYLESRKSFYNFYKIHNNWFDAKKRCTIEGARLWYPEDQEELDTVLKFWKERQPSLLKLHVGISDLLFEGQWETIDGKRREDIWNVWGPGQPNNGVQGEDCAIMRRDFYIPGEVDLISASCSSLKPFICKMTLSSLDWNYPCNVRDKKYIFNPELSRCYKFHQNLFSWNEAYAACIAEESYLAVINSEKEKDLLVKIVADEKIPWVNVDVTQVHLGFHNQSGEGWQTVTGELLEESGYVVWGQNQPDGGDKEQCGAMFINGVFNDLNCDKQLYFICEHDIGREKGKL